jgi:hypothetical protein
MTEYNLVGYGDHIALNPSDTVAVVDPAEYTTNQTRTMRFDTKLLQEWLEALEEAYGREVEIQFTPGMPAVGYPRTDDETTMGIAIAPRLDDDEKEQHLPDWGDDE